MNEKKVVIGFTLLIIEGFLILLSSSVEKSGRASFFGIGGNAFSDITVILTVVFLTTLIALMISMGFLRGAKHGSSSRTTRISEEYFDKSVEQSKPKSQIIKELKEEGFKDNEITAFLKDFRKRV